MVSRYDCDGIRIVQGDARAVSQTIEPGSCSLAILDGPYGLGKAAWDRVSDLPAWYAPHLDDVDRVCGASASLYVWNTAGGWAALHPGIVARGWTYRSLIVWADPNPPSVIGWSSARHWPNAHEVCGFYTRGDARALLPAPASDVWLTGRHSWGDERLTTGRVVASKTAVNMDGHGSGTTRETLHPCQKPLAFAERMIRASTRPGERVWVPFGGTCREAIAAQRIARADPAEAREVVTAELDEDGRDYLGAVVRVLEGRGTAPPTPGQVSLW